MTTYETRSDIQDAPQYQPRRLVGWFGGAVLAMKWALHVQHGCERARAAGETLDGVTIRRVAAAADAALGVS